ncbi:aminotransferase class I/II-fold pyridoxal phosphate-dependent enzyme [Bacillus lacus]|uniref:Aminotransferase class I/II-fold pyridoxal phosphate-dependent enzyme n=1 Tax=Metabacillus lacus TaxID=1983721 RepID=A0A7X2J011_9BACI|nr:aminotransferase class I/II-fold pyridoxal phosphate-dependent enzyme [Metabacillus lacus]MRX72931.1 aminotransferase class I/II-fold pyridoxal phosphate-dependent enzyme [Metabacillus lacus]
MKTPIYTSLVEHAKKGIVSLHVPGHHQGIVFPADAFVTFKDILKIDVTELSGLDDLHEPEGIIQEAQQLASEFFGVQQTYFLVNGSTVGNIAGILSLSQAGEQVLVQRNCHKSILNGLELAGAQPIFLEPCLDEELKVASHVPLTTIEKALEQYPEAKALILTNPTYYGTSADLTAVVEAAHKKEIPVLVDEAHGAHFAVGAPFPRSAVESGADIVVQSAHKTLPAMTMGSYLHYNSVLADQNKLTRTLAMLQSSSPSYPIMASLDIARAYLQELRNEDRGRAIEDAVKAFHEELNRIPGIKTVISNNKEMSHDPLKVSVQSTEGLTGYELQALFEQAGIYGELSDYANFLMVLPLAVQNPPYKELLLLEQLLKQYTHKQAVEQKVEGNADAIKSLPYSYDQLKKWSIEVVPAAESIGRINAQQITPYPPGIPLLMTGEPISLSHIQQMEKLLAAGAKLQGSAHIKKGQIAVYQER